MMRLPPRGKRRARPPGAPGPRVAVRFAGEGGLHEATSRPGHGFPEGLFYSDWDVSVMLIAYVASSTKTVGTLQAMALVDKTWLHIVRNYRSSPNAPDRSLRLSAGNRQQMRWLSNVAPKYEATRSLEFTYAGDPSKPNGRVAQRFCIGTLRRELPRLGAVKAPLDTVFLKPVGWAPGYAPSVQPAQGGAGPVLAQQLNPGEPSPVEHFLDSELASLQAEIAEHGLQTSLRALREARYHRSWTFALGPDFEESVARGSSFWSSIGSLNYKSRFDLPIDAPKRHELTLFVTRRREFPTQTMLELSSPPPPHDFKMRLRCDVRNTGGARRNTDERVGTIVALALEHGVRCALELPSTETLIALVRQLLSEGRRPAYGLKIAVDAAPDDGESLVYDASVHRCMSEMRSAAWSHEALAALAVELGQNPTAWALT